MHLVLLTILLFRYCCSYSYAFNTHIIKRNKIYFMRYRSLNTQIKIKNRKSEPQIWYEIPEKIKKITKITKNKYDLA